MIYLRQQPGINEFSYNRGKDTVVTKIFYKDCNETEGTIRDIYRKKGKLVE